MQSKDASLCVEFSRHVQYVVEKYYKKMSNPSLVNETLLVIAAQMLKLYSPEERIKMHAALQKISFEPEAPDPEELKVPPEYLVT